MLCGCSLGQTKNPQELGINIAKDIQITYETGPKIGLSDSLDAVVKNNSKNCIEFPIDFGLKILMEKNDAWIPVFNLTKYEAQPGDTSVILDRKGTIFSEKMIVAEPDLSNITLSGATNFQANISGHLCEDKSITINKSIPFVVSP